MKRVFLTAAGLMALLYVQAQKSTDSTGFVSRKLKLEEINLVSSYYTQNGDNASVTGGIGSQKLTDIANVFDVKLTRYDKKLRKNTFDIELGIDHYTSASSDKIDLNANSSASYSDTRFYPSVNWNRENETKGTTIGAGVSSSTEYDYQSFGGSISFAKKNKNRTGEFSARFQAYLDQVKLIAPVELRFNGDNASTSGRNSISGVFSYSRIINQRLQVAFLADIVQQTGYLSLPFHRVYFKDNSVHQENLPDNRFKLPLGVRASYFIGDRFIVKTYYRFYTDDWGLTAHTADLEVPVKITPFLSVSPFYRFYNQSAIKYFAPFQKHTAQEQYYTSNYDLSAFHSHFLGAGIRIAPPGGVFGWQHFNMLEIRYGHYSRSTDMTSNIISMNIKYK